MLPFGRLCQGIVLMCVLHVQHDYFPSFNQSDHCILASSLPLPSSLLKLPKNCFVIMIIIIYKIDVNIAVFNII